MDEILSQLGVNWRLLLSQGVNFFIVLGVLTVFVWKPLTKLIKERGRQIEKSLENAKEIEARLHDIEREREESVKMAERHALDIMREAEKKARVRFEGIVSEAERKSADTLQEGLILLERKKKEELLHLEEEAKGILLEAIAKVVQADPHAIDEHLIKEAETHLKKEIRS